MSLTTSWARYFDGRVRMRGRAYHNEGRVEPVATREGELFRATVRGRDDDYTVTFRGNGSPEAATCTCPHFDQGHYCKHIWASLLSYEERMAPGDERGDEADVVRDDGAKTAATARVAPAMPKARKRTGKRRAAQPVEPLWMTKLSLLRTPGFQLQDEAAATTPAPDLREVYYIVDVEKCKQFNGLVIDLHYKQPLQTGWSKLKRLKLNPTTALQLNDPVDREICGMIIGGMDTDALDHYYTGDYLPKRSRYLLPRSAWHGLLKRMIETGRCMLHAMFGDDQPMQWDAPSDTPWSLWVVGEKQPQVENEKDWQLSVSVELRRTIDQQPQVLAIDEPHLLLGGQNGLVFYRQQVAPFDDAGAFRWVTQFRDDLQRYGEAPPLEVPSEDVPRFLDRIYLLPNLPEMDLPEGIGRAERRVPPTPHLEISSPSSTQKKNVTARMWLTYDGREVGPDEPGRFISSLAQHTHADDTPHANADASSEAPDELSKPVVDGPAGQPTVIRRDRRQEANYYRDLLKAGFRAGTGQESEQLVLPVKQMLSVASRLIAGGWQIEADRRTLRQSATPHLAVASGIDWFELRGSVAFQTDQGEQLIDLPTILKAARAGKTTVQLDDGSEGLLPQEWLAQHGLLASIGKLQGDHIRFQSSQAALIDSMLADFPEVDVDEKFAAAREQLHNFEGVKPLQPSKRFVGELREYQANGLGWLKFLDQFGMGGILADDMGLGKTIQILAMLDRHYGGSRNGSSDRPPHRPTLIVAPRSVVFNWLDEAERFTPKLRVQPYTGSERQLLREQFDQQDLIVTSYGLMRRDIEELREHSFEYVILDEAQAIKNPNSQSAKATRLLDCRHRLALTGTPVENHIGDLWSIFEFLNPGMLGSNTRFADLLRRGTAIAASARPNDKKSGESVAQIARALKPFILRRTKTQVLKDLPPKTEQTIHCEMESEQRKVYDDLRQYYRSTLLKQGGEPQSQLVMRGGGASGGPAMPMMVLEALLRLRQAACHPGLIDEKRIDQPSAKLEVLLDRLGDLVEEGHKALVFSQFTSMLSIVRKQLDKKELNYAYLDGQTRNRKQIVERFQNDPDCPIFLISLKAGGVGLNLTAAEYVFILDPWWNPAVESQAIDRTHRIGQTQHVFAYRLICEDTVEQRILELQDRKRKLADAIVGGQENVLRSLTREDLEKLLS